MFKLCYQKITKRPIYVTTTTCFNNIMPTYPVWPRLYLAVEPFTGTERERANLTQAVDDVVAPQFLLGHQVTKEVLQGLQRFL